MLDKNERKSADRLYNSKKNEESKGENGKSFSKSLTKSVAIVGSLAVMADYVEFVNIPSWVIQICFLYIVVIIIWQVADCIGYNRLKRGAHWITVIVKNLFKIYWKTVVVSSTVLLLFGVIFCAFYHTNRYYKEVTEIYGLPRGVGSALSREERMQSAGYWKIIDYPFRHQITLDFIEPYGQLDLMQEYSSLYQMAFFRPSAKIVYQYERGEKNCCPEEITYYNSSGKLLLQLEKKDRGNYEVVRCAEEDKPQLLNSTLFRVPEGKVGKKLTAVQLETFYDEDGRPQVRRLGAEAYNQYGVNGESYEYDQAGRLISLRYLDIHGQPMCNSLGIMTVAFVYGGDGQLDSIQYFSDEKMTEKTEGFWGVACEKFDYYQDGNLKERRQESRDGNWWYDIKQVYMYQYTYDNGRLVQEKYLGQGQVPTREKEFRSSSMEFAKSESGGKRVITITLDSVDNFEEADNRGTLSSGPETDFQEKDSSSGDFVEKLEGYNAEKQTSIDESLDHVGNYATIQYTLNKHNHILEKGYYSINGEPVASDEGYSAKRFEYDSNLRIIEEAYYDIDKNPCFVKGGYAKIRNTYGPDNEDEIIRKEYLDENGNLVLNRESGYAFVQYDYLRTANGKVVCKSFYDLEGRPTCMKEYGCARIQETYDYRGLLTEEAYQDKKGMPTNRTNYGIAYIRNDYGEDGNVVRSWYLDVDGKIANRLDMGYAAIHQEFKDGQLVKEVYKGYENQEWKNVPSRDTGAASVEYTYVHGRKQKEEYFDTVGNPVLRSDTGYASVEYKYDNAGMVCEQCYYGVTDELILRKDRGYAVIELAYDDYGRCKSERYYGTEGYNPVISSKYHCAGFDYGYDERGNRNKICSLDLDGTPLVRSDCGYAVIDKAYDNQGNVIKEEYFDEEGRATATKEGGYASYKSEYEKGLWKESRYYDAQGNLTLRNDTGYALIRLEYDEYGQDKAVRYFGTDESPVISTEYHCACEQYLYDERGNLTDITYLDVDDTLMIRSDLGYARVHMEYDDRDQIREVSYYDTAGKPALCKDKGYASYTNEYDGGKWVSSRYYDQTGGMILRSDTGYAMITLGYNAYGDCMEEHYYGINEEPVISTKYHCASRIWERDALGNMVDLYYKGLENELIVRSDLGYAHIHKEYDEQGNSISESYYDVEEKPTVCKKGGFASYKNFYENGRWIEGRYYDAQQNLTLRTDNGYAVIKLEYDVYGNQIAECFWGMEEDPIISTIYACARIEYAYDKKGNSADDRYFGLDGKPMIRRDLGYAQIHREYDEQGNNIRVSYFGVNSEPVNHKESGCASYQDIFENGKWVEGRYYDEHGDLVLRKDRGYAVIKLEYDAYGKEVAEYYFDTENKPVISSEYECAGRQYEYNEKEEITNICYVGQDGELITRLDQGYSELRREYDAFGNITKESYFDAVGAPAMKKEEGYASFVSIYKNGKRSESRFYDQNDNLVRRKDKGYALIRLEYDAYGEEIAEYYYGTEEQPVMGTEYYCAGRSFEHDEKGQTTVIRYLGLDKKQINLDDKEYSEIRKEYNDFGLVERESYFDAQGNPVALQDEGYASLKNTYVKGKRVETKYYDKDGKPILRKDHGYASETMSYDAYGKCTERFFYGTDGKLVTDTESSCAGFRYEYDERGNQTDTWYYGTDGKLTTCRGKGYAQMHREYNFLDQEVKISFFDSFGELVMCEDSGYAYCIHTYNNNHRTESWYYDTQGKLTQRTDEGYAVKTVQYNAYGQKISESYFDANIRSVMNTKYHCSGWLYNYDDRGNDTYYWYYGTDGNQVLREDIGAALYFKKFDACDHLIWEGFYDKDLQLVVRKDSDYAAISYTYDQNRMIEKAYLDADGNLVYHEQAGYAKIEYEYCDFGERAATSTYDADGNLVKNKMGYARIEYEYDSTGNMDDWTYFNEKGEEIEL